MKKLTVFTPTYNRVDLLPKLYQSLINQTNNDFIWLIIDDGSSDNTEDVVNSWQKDNKIEIIYLFKENGGMHTAHNKAYEVIETELNVCIDSDDCMPKEGVQRILEAWSKVNNKNSVSGIVGLDAESDGKIIGSLIPKHLTSGSYYDLYEKSKVTGDKKFVLNTALVKKYDKYPEYEDEKLVPLGILYIMMGEDYPFIFTNDIFCIVEYQIDGSSNTIFKQYAKSPKGFLYARNIGKKYNKSFFYNVKNSIHIVSSAIFAKDITLINIGKKVYLNYLVFPLGILLNIYLRIKLYEKNI